MKIDNLPRFLIAWLVVALCVLQAQTASTDSLVIYNNSFEVPEDTTDWVGLGYWMFVEDPAPGQGSRSLLVGGGCLQPAAWIDIPCTTGDGTYRLSFWGKAGEVTPGSGCVVVGPADWYAPATKMVEVCTDSLNWTFYQAEKDLQIGGIDSLRIQIWVGGIIYDDMQIDNLEVVKYPLLGTGRAEPAPAAFYLAPAFPNPFNPTTTIRFDLPMAGEVSLMVYDLLGREVARLVDGYMEPGYHQTQWNGRNVDGYELPSGIYIARLTTPEYSKAVKMLLLK
ncbi:MAG: T9SS type A sorting domain-containing protein [Candidatus Neomarinimicrobiota bacterium]